MSEVLTIEDIRGSFGIADPNATESDQQDTSTDEDATEDSTETEDTEESTDEGAQEEESEESEEEEQEESKKTPAQKDPLESAKPKVQKEAHAFAELRTQNTKQQEIIKSVAAVLGLDLKQFSKPEELVNAVEQVVIAAQAKERGMAPEDLQELNVLRSERRYIVAQEGLISLQDEFKVPDDKVKAFVQELVDDGMNPLEMDVDLRKEYLARHVADIMAAAKASAAEEAAARKEKNNRAPGMPPGKGKQQAEPKQIKTVAELDTFLNNIKL